MNALETPNKTLFLSYSRRQTKWCDDLYTAIDTFTHYQRWRDNKIPESADWWDSICVNIEGCFAFVAILTQDYLDSVYCMGELEYALKLNKPIIALMLNDVDYPQQLNELRLQFARVGGLAIPQVINKVLSATNQVMLAYVQGGFSTDIHPRQHLRPRVPSPKASTPTPKEDVILSEQIDDVAIHGQISTGDLIRRYGEERNLRNVRLARELLNKISQRADVPRFFQVDSEDRRLKIAEKSLIDKEKRQKRLKKIGQDYNALASYVETLSRPEARALVQEFIQDYSDYGDPQALLRKYPPTSLDLMPKPFDWIPIPAGQVTLGKSYDNKAHSVGQTFTVDSFDMAKYPVTNAQYAKFIEAGGYDNDSWWTEAGWVERQKDKWTEPRYWTNSDFNSAEQPVVGISWYEAIAFCLWLSEATGEKISLPSEQQWQYAAQGKEGYDYPWGNERNRDLCNNSADKKGIGKTSPVAHYEDKGDSPFGVVDMAGNVWEWCLTEYETGSQILKGTNVRVLRGGSWNNLNSDNFLCHFRYGYFPDNWFLDRGFRISRFK